MTTFLRIQARDPLVARDGRPFGIGQGNRMRSVGWPYPSVVAGSLRTAVGKAAGRPFDEATREQLLRMHVAGVFPAAGGTLYLPAPNDCVWKTDGPPCRAYPQEPRHGEGGDWPAEGLWPVMLNDTDSKDDFKPSSGPAYWSVNRYAGWLAQPTTAPRDLECLSAPLTENREHVGIDADVGAAQEGVLFTTVGVAASALPKWDDKGPQVNDASRPTGPPRFDRFTEVELVARVEDTPDWMRWLPMWHPLGGERRLAHWRTCDDRDLWNCPEDVRSALTDAKRVSMTLATPAVFADGWKPGWLTPDLTGTPPGGGPELRLMGVCISRWRAVSGWSYVTHGPKAVRRMVPAGGVYYFQVLGGRAESLATEGWLRPVSDAEQDRRDGFGLTLWGVW